MHTTREFELGLLSALAAFLFWGLVPVFFKQLVPVPALEVVSHRILWSVVILALIITLMGKWRFWHLITVKTFLALALSACLMTSNWFIFIWAVAEGKILSTSLGYFINPLVSVLLGLLFLGERLRRWQMVAVFLAVAGVLNQLVWVGSLPWVALLLAFSFGLYGLIRKQLSIKPLEGLFVEACFMLPFALLYFGWLYKHDSLVFLHQAAYLDVLLVAAGWVTVIPLLLFAAATQRLPLNIVGMVQYLTPTMSFLIAIKVYDEPFSAAQLITFVFIWAGLIVFTAEGVHQGKLKRKVSNI